MKKQETDSKIIPVPILIGKLTFVVKCTRGIEKTINPISSMMKIKLDSLLDKPNCRSSTVMITGMIPFEMPIFSAE